MFSFCHKQRNRGICIGTILVILLLLCFHGKLYVSRQGYLLFRHSLAFGSEDEQGFVYDTCYDTVVNGERVYILTYSGEGHIPPDSFRFTLLTEHYGNIEIAVTKENGEVVWKLMDSAVPISDSEDLDETLSVISDFFGEYWSENCLVILDYESINEGRFKQAVIAIAVILILQAAPLFCAVMANKEGDSKYQKSCYCVFGILQLLVMVLHFFHYVTVM